MKHHPFQDIPSESGGIPLQMPQQDALSLAERIGALHGQLRKVVPKVHRMACAVYDPKMDLLKTFVNSTMEGSPLSSYQYRLSDSPSLSALAKQREARVIDDIPEALPGDSQHTVWLRSEGYRSSYTMPLYHQGVFEGFLFLDSYAPGVFTPAVLEKIEPYCQFVLLMISHEVTAIQTLVGSIRIARDFAHLRDIETGTHLDRMSRYTRLIARRLARTHGLNDEFIEQLFLFAPLHDIGKVGIPDAILLKPGRFTPEERAIMMEHVVLGSAMIERLVGEFNLGTVAGINILRNLVAGHHEFLDGSGYPKGLRSEQIPIEARIVTVADIFDALTSKRVYKEAWDLKEALATMDGMVEEGKLDADCVRVLREGTDEVLQIMRLFQETENLPS